MATPKKGMAYARYRIPQQADMEAIRTHAKAAGSVRALSQATGLSESRIYNLLHKMPDGEDIRRSIQTYGTKPNASVPVVGQLQSRRQELRRSGRDLEGELGWSSGRLTKYENGQVVPRLDHLMDWARALGMELQLIERP